MAASQSNPPPPYLGLPLPQAPAWDQEREERRLHWGLPPKGWSVRGAKEDHAECLACLSKLQAEAERRRQEAEACEERGRRGRMRKTKVLQTKKMERIVCELEQIQAAKNLDWSLLQSLSPEALLFVGPSLVTFWREAQDGSCSMENSGETSCAETAGKDGASETTQQTAEAAAAGDVS